MILFVMFLWFKLCNILQSHTRGFFLCLFTFFSNVLQIGLSFQLRYMYIHNHQGRTDYQYQYRANMGYQDKNSNPIPIFVYNLYRGKYTMNIKRKCQDVQIKVFGSFYLKFPNHWPNQCTFKKIRYFMCEYWSHHGYYISQVSFIMFMLKPRWLTIIWIKTIISFHSPVWVQYKIPIKYMKYESYNLSLTNFSVLKIQCTI